MFTFLYAVLSIPYFMMVYLLIRDALQTSGAIEFKRDYKADFMLDSDVIQLLVKVIWIWIAVTVLSWFFPPFIVAVNIIDYIVTALTWYWVYQNWKAGKIQSWFQKK